MPTGYYQKNKGKLQNQARERYQNLPKEKQNKKVEYLHKCYKNLCEDEKKLQSFTKYLRLTLVFM